MTKEEYNTCVTSFADSLYRFMRKGTNDGEHARDLVQDSFEKLWLNKGKIEVEKAKSYLFTTGYHSMIDMLRKSRRFELNSVENASAELLHNQSYCDLNEVLHRAIKQLSPEQRSVLLLRDYEGYSYAEIVEITGLSESQVKVYIYRARLFLRNYVGSIETIL